MMGRKGRILRICFSYLSTWLLLASVLLSGINIFILVHFVPSCNVKDLDFDYYGVIIGVLSLLITVLVGWNIYAVINVTESKKENDLKVRQFFAKVDENTQKTTAECANVRGLYTALDSKVKQNALSNTENILDVLSASGLVSEEKDTAASIRVFCRLLVLYYELNDKSSYGDILDFLYQFYKENVGNDIFSKDDANSILAILFPIAKQLANDKKFAEFYNWMSSFLMK